MSNAKKVLILTLTMIFAIAVSATVVSFSFAGGTSKDKASDNEKVTAKDAVPLSMADSLADSLTNIDHIIDKANNTALPEAERVFHIVQIVSNGNKDTSLKAYVENGGFGTHVINNNRSAGHAELPQQISAENGTVDTVQIDVLTVADLQTIVATKPLDYSRVTIADLVVISNDPAAPFIGGDVATGNTANDIPEDIHKILQPYAVGQYKPLIIDWAGTTSSSEDPYSMKSLATNVLSKNYIKFRTFSWKDGVGLKDFLNRKGSVYIPLEILDQNYKTSKVLVVHGDGNASQMYNALTGDDTFKDNAFYRKGYQPDNVVVDRISYQDIANSSFADDYDFVFIENDTYSGMNASIYNAISVVSFAKKHVIYPAALEAATNTSSDSDNESNYKELLYTVASKEGISLYKNVYLSSFTFFDAMAADPAGTQEAADTVAELLKASTYREFGANSASGKKYTVLEIQPAYPVDEELAKKNGGYYTVPNNVYKSSKELTPEGSEYYAFEMTMEKVMALTGLDASEIELVQMSAEELQGIKKSITDKYDLVYIGGNVSALTAPEDYNFNNGGRISQFIKSEEETRIVLTTYPAGSTIPASESEDGKEHTVEEENRSWPSYTIDHALLPADTKYKAGDTIPASETVDEKPHQVQAYGDRLGYDTGWFVYVVSDYKVGDTVPAEKSVDGTPKTVGENWAFKRFYRVVTKSTRMGYAYYQMYSHTGAYVVSDESLYGVEAGDYADSGGNDITSANLQNLKAYIDSGMPIIFSDDVTEAYKEMKTSGDPYENPMLDPDSNMSKLLEHALNTKGAESGKAFTISSPKNVLSDLDKDDTIRVANLTGKYGDSAISGADYVEIFNDGKTEPYMVKDAAGKWVDHEDGDPIPGAADSANTAGAKIRSLIQNCMTRPTMNLESMPTIYVANTPSSYLQTPSLSYSFELLTNGNANIESFTVTLYIDDNSNGLFTDSGEAVKSVTVPVVDGKAVGSIAYEMSADFYGPVSWKIEAVANVKSGTTTVPGPSISYNAVSKVVRTSTEKDLVHILQIMPKSTSQQGNATLYFCIDCQLENQIALYNAHLNSGASKNDRLTYIAAMYQNYGATANVAELKNDTSFNSANEAYYRYRSSVLKLIDDANHHRVTHFGTGLHQHNFGIWKYDSDIGYDDWNSNLADALTGEDGDFEFDIDIFCPEDLDAMEQEYANNDVAELQKKYEQLKKKDDASETEIAAAKQAIKELEDEKLAAAENIYEEYENLVTLTERVERDLRNVLQYFADNEATLKSKFADSILDYNVFADVLENRNYNDILSNNKTTWRDYDATKNDNVDLKFTAQRINDAGILEDFEYQVNKDFLVTSYYYQRWADAKSLEVLKLEEYWEAVRASYGKDWMKEVYGVVLVGAAENFGDQDLTQKVCDRLSDYEKAGGNILMFHDTMARNKNGAVKLTNTLRNAFGLNRYHMTKNGANYQLDAGYDASKYFLTRMTIAGDMLVAKLTNYAWNGQPTDYRRTLVGMSTNFAVYKNGIKSAPYKYGETNLFDELTNWSKDFQTYQKNMNERNFSSNRATQVNSGIITSYPFTISDKLNISLTHGQFLTLDVEDDEVITWYALAASNAKHQYTSMYAADPGDAADNYFIFSRGNVNYCGAGHAKVTGPLTDNNDERMLFINIICNSARKRALKPSIKIYDPDNKKVVPSAGNKYILQNTEGEPYIEVGSQTEKIKFGFLATVDTKASPSITNTRIYFLYDENGDGKVDTTDKEEVIYTFKGDDALTSGIDYYVNTTDATAKKIADSITLKPEYFRGYDDCAYVYIEVTDSNGERLTEKIRIDFVGELFDMTDNSIEQHPLKPVLEDFIKDL